MILEFKCSNCKSIKDEITFSMLACNTPDSDEYLYDASNYKILRSAAIYGANGSGKSNVINAIAFMRNLVCSNITYKAWQNISQESHKLSPIEMPSIYCIQFIKNDVRYAYGFSISCKLTHAFGYKFSRNVVSDEYLYVFKNGKQVKVFEREGLSIHYGRQYQTSMTWCEDALQDNRLFLSCAAAHSHVHEIEEAFDFFASDLLILNSENNGSDISYCIHMLQNNETLQKKLALFLGYFDTGIKNINISANGAKVKFVYDRFETDISEESSGIVRLFQILCLAIDAIFHDKVLICDNLELGLHQAVVCQIVKLFQFQHHISSAQLIFSTHDIALLNDDVLRHDQIWFTQLNSECSTELYSLVEFKDTSNVDRIAYHYMNGAYGAVPHIMR